MHHNTDLWRFTDAVPGLPQWVHWASALWWLTDHAVQHHAYLPPEPEAESVLNGQVRVRRTVSLRAGETVTVVAP